MRNFLEGRLVEERVPFPSDHRPFSGHVTFARLSNTLKSGVGNLPDIEQAAHIVCVPASLDLMESELSQKGATYTILQKFPFSGDN